VAEAIFRWALFSAALFEAGTAVYVDLVHAERLGRGQQRIEFLAIGIASLLLAVGAWYQVSVGWFAGLALAAYNVVETTLRWRTYMRGDDAHPTVILVFLFVNVLVIGLLVAPLGRGAFGVSAR
jgi:hypothetical protein